MMSRRRSANRASLVLLVLLVVGLFLPVAMVSDARHGQVDEALSATILDAEPSIVQPARISLGFVRWESCPWQPATTDDSGAVCSANPALFAKPSHAVLAAAKTSLLDLGCCLRL